MKIISYRTWFIAAVCLALAACSKDEPAAPSVSEPAVEEPVVAQPEDAEEAQAAQQETQEVVEESAAEPEPEDETITLAQADPVEAPESWQFSEGEHYSRMVPTQPTVGGADKIEVAEFFWYGCPHCLDFEPYLQRWDAEKPANVRFVKIPIVWNPVAQLHGRMYYTGEILIRNGVIEDGEAFHNTVFQEYHRRGNRMASEGAVKKIFERFGVTSEQFESTWSSFEVDQKLRVANDLMRRYKIDGVPAVVVNGKYRTGAAEAGGYPKVVELINELIVRESLR